jgi:hypothetical protein
LGREFQKAPDLFYFGELKMKVTITYHDNDSFTIEEVVKQAVHNYGKAAQIEIMPESTLAYDHIYFGLQQLITHEQLSLLYDKDTAYQQDIKKLRESVLYKVTEIIDQVIIDNESKVG